MTQKKVSVVIVTKDRKKDLVECVDSYLACLYKNLEIIVVDNASKPPLLIWFPQKYKTVKLITTDANLGAAEGRNVGFAQATGEYIVFTDDDAYADKDMVSELVKVFEEHKNAGIAQPLVYDKNAKQMLQGAGHDINLLTGRIIAWGVQEKDTGQYVGIRKVPMCGCVWMVARKVFTKIGTYDEDYFIPYEDSDFSIRARKAGFGLYCNSMAKTWHQGIKTTYVHPWVEWLGITSPVRAYRVARNKIIFMRKHSPFPQNLFFFFIMLPCYALAHSLIIILARRFDILLQYWLGLISGIIYALAFPFLGLREQYKVLDNKLKPFKMFLMAWTDPIPLVTDKNVRTILDLGCGDGKLMIMIKSRRHIDKAVGVDIFEADLDSARARNTHEEYLLQDVRKVSFPKKSFDLVLSSHVVEHLPKMDAEKFIAKMEAMANKQVIIATPIGETYHPAVGGNIHQMHLSSFVPEDFHKMGYKTINYGWKWLLAEDGLAHTVKSELARKLVYGFNILVTPIYYLFPQISDYVFVAYKDVHNEK